MLRDILSNLNEYLIKNDVFDKSTIDIYNEWVNISNLHIKENKDISFCISYIEKMKIVHKDFLKNLIEA